MNRHELEEDLGPDGDSWIEQYEWDDLEAYLVKHAAFLDWLDFNEER